MKGFALGLGLKQRQKTTRKWIFTLQDLTVHKNLTKTGGTP